MGLADLHTLIQPSSPSWGRGGVREDQERAAGMAAVREMSPDPCPALIGTPQRALQAEPRTAKLPELGAKPHGGSRVNARLFFVFSIWDKPCPRSSLLADIQSLRRSGADTAEGGGRSPGLWLLRGLCGWGQVTGPPLPQFPLHKG